MHTYIHIFHAVVLLLTIYSNAPQRARGWLQEDDRELQTVLNSKLPFQYPVATELLTLSFESNKDYSMLDRVSSSAKKRMPKPSHTTLQPYVLQDASFLCRYVI